MVISQNDFETWKADPVTKAFMIALADAVEAVKEDLAASAGLDSADDNFKRGYIRANMDALLFRVEDIDGN